MKFMILLHSNPHFAQRWEALTPEQRAELAALSQSVLGDLGLQYELDRLGRALRARRPDLRWDQGAAVDGDQPLGLGFLAKLLGVGE